MEETKQDTLTYKFHELIIHQNKLSLRADPRENIPFSLLLLRVGFFLISLHQCYSLRTFAHLKEHS